MANREYDISSSSLDDASSSTSSTTMPIKSDSTICNCQQRSAATTDNCSSTRRRNSRNNMIGQLSINSPFYLAMIMLVFISYFTCCVSAWPILNHRRTYNYAPSPVVIPDYNELVDVNQWALAAQPDAYYYDTLPALPLQQQQIDEDLEDDGQIFDQDPEEETYQMPFFGPIMDVVEPEEELELEELKHQQPFVYEKRRPVTATVKPAAVVPSAQSAATPVSTESSPSSTATPTPANGQSKVTAGQPHLASPSRKISGQKEIAMLRPPASSKSHHIQLDEPEEPKISVAQRSPSNEKPSAYDRLRKYLSLDDALKKEYQQRRANAMNRHHKRESMSSIITDSDSLTGQLNNLKKSMD